ncbi:MAG: metallophosphoesterase [Eubacterium sp.]|nr:metallophosphoesterase [Eubacterium sp.]
MAEKVKKSRGKKALKVILIIVLVIALLVCACGVVNQIAASSHKNLAKSLEAVSYENQLVPELDRNGNYTFVTDGDFKVMQLTDIHIGAGFMSTQKDNMAINAVSSMIRAEKPDLVCISGDIGYPVPFQSGTINNKSDAVIFAEMMEALGVYWAPVFGNHDTESFSLYDREDIGEIYESEEYPHCLFQAGPEDIYGVGNYVINVKNTKGEITQSIFMMDSNDYTSNSILSSLSWDYDCIHTDQIEWYKSTVDSLTAENGGIIPKSIVFFHIPLIEVKDAWYEYRDNGYQDTENVQYIYGKAGEGEGDIMTGLGVEDTAVVFCSEHNNGFFDALAEKGSTQAMFFGHDHLNTFSIYYKGIRMTYGYSVDYLAYKGISTIGSQRGCTMITVKPDGSIDVTPENYYQDKYVSAVPKEEVTMQEYTH